MPSRISRRRVLQSGLVSLGYLFTGPAGSVRKVYGAANQLRVAGIGVGGKGSSDIEQAGNVMEVVALCDIDDERLNSRAKTWPGQRSSSTTASYLTRWARILMLSPYPLPITPRTSFHSRQCERGSTFIARSPSHIQLLKLD